MRLNPDKRTKIVVIGSSNTDMVIQADRLPARVKLSWAALFS